MLKTDKRTTRRTARNAYRQWRPHSNDLSIDHRIAAEDLWTWLGASCIAKHDVVAGRTPSGNTCIRISRYNRQTGVCPADAPLSRPKRGWNKVARPAPAWPQGQDRRCASRWANILRRIPSRNSMQNQAADLTRLPHFELENRYRVFSLSLRGTACSFVLCVARCGKAM